MINKKIWVSIVLFMLFVCSLSISAQSTSEDVLNYFTSRAKQVYTSRNPFLAGLSFSFDAKTYHKLYDDESNLFISDSMEATYYVSFEHVDSIVVTTSPHRKFDSLIVSYPNIFENEYVYNFYPNDTGGPNVAIGYDTEEMQPGVPVGIAVIDRNYYFLKQLYMHFMHPIKVERESKSIRFIEIDGYVFPDSIWEVKCNSGIFTTEYYRLETGITNIQIKR